MSKIQRKSLVLEVFEAIRQGIETGLYPIDQQLPTEPVLMKTYGVGRSTVREAIIRLTNSGYVQVQQGLGSFVRSKTGNEVLENTLKKATLEDLLEVRYLLEGKIAEKAALNRKSKDISRLKLHLKDRKKYARNGDLKSCVQADIAFHVVIAESCGNPILTDLYKVTAEKISGFFLEQYTTTDAFLQTHALHEEVLHHIKEQDPAKTLLAVKRIIGKD